MKIKLILIKDLYLYKIKLDLGKDLEDRIKLHLKKDFHQETNLSSIKRFIIIK